MILIIDSNVDNKIILKTMLAIIVSEKSLISADTRENALEQAVKNRPEIILLNEKIKGQDALEVCNLLKSDSRTEGIPVIVIISSQSTLKTGFIQNGADGFISKPIDHSELTLQVNTMLKLKRLESIIKKEKKAQEKIRKSETRYQYLIEHANEAIAIIDKDGKFQLINKEGLYLIGEEKTSFKNKTLYDICEKEFADNSIAVIRKTIKTRKEISWREIKLLLKGELKYLSICTQPIENELGNINSVFILARNMTLRILEEKQKYIIRQVSQLILFSKNIDNVYRKIPELLIKNLNFNYAALEIYNKEAGKEYFFSESNSLEKGDKSKSKNIIKSIDSTEHNNINHRMENLKVKSFICMPIKIDNKSFGSIFLADSRKRKDISAFSDTLQVISNNLAQEILRRNAESALLKSEEMLRHSQKMEAIGRLSGGISHDFNNLLTIISGYSESIIIDSSVANSVKDKVLKIKESAEKAGDLVQRLLTFSRKKSIELKILNLNKLILGLENMLKRLLGEDIILYIDLDPDISNIKADAGQFEQIIMNLAINSRDALPNGGNLIIETRKLKNDKSSLFVENGLVTEYINLLKISDNGNGIETEIIDKIFEPFFTTKEIGKGTGLGLSTVKTILDQFGGVIKVESNKGLGTSFFIYFPYFAEEKVQDMKEEIAAAALQSKPPKRGTETILVVEDQENVREMICTMLEDFGYKVFNAKNGIEALSILNGKNRKQIDLLLTDVIMPELNGYELAKRMMETVPDLKVLYMSGYTDGIIDEKGKIDKPVKFIKKPFTTYELVNKIYKVLNT